MFGTQEQLSAMQAQAFKQQSVALGMMQQQQPIVQQSWTNQQPARSQYEAMFGPTALAAYKSALDSQNVKKSELEVPSKPSNNLTKEKSMFTELKTYIKEYRTVIFTIAFVALADHFLFEGSFRSRLKALVDSLLKRAEVQTEKKDA